VDWVVKPPPLTTVPDPGLLLSWATIETGGNTMPKYLIQVAYSDDALADLVRQPEDRGAVISELVDRLGGKVEAFYHSLGQYDIVIIAEFPDNETVAAIQIAVRAAGVEKYQNVTTLLTREEAVNALRRAGSSGYQPPS
jgi:uncharacterized protein with GYD domain